MKTPATMILGAAIALTFTAGAVTKTYTQCGFTEVQNIAMDGLPSSTEITATPQLAFPGVTLDDINQCTFISELYGGGVDNRATAWGVYPKRHKTNGSIDKLSLQFGVKDGTYTKVSILVLTNGATVKLTGMNNAQSVTGTFAAAGTVNVDGSAISDADLKAAGMVPVLSAPSLPAGIKQRFSALGASNRTFRVVTEDGISTVYMSRTNGFLIFVK